MLFPLFREHNAPPSGGRPTTEKRRARDGRRCSPPPAPPRPPGRPRAPPPAPAPPPGRPPPPQRPGAAGLHCRVALHGGHLPGYPASHGCVRLPNAFAAKLFAATRIGTEVVIGEPDGPPGGKA